MGSRKRTGRRWSRASLLVLAAWMAGCGGGGGGDQTAAVSEVNQAYLGALAANNYMAHPAAQPPADLYVPARHFALVSSALPLAAAVPAAAPVLYRPAYAAAARPGLRKDAALPQGLAADEIPGFKGLAAMPAGCAGLADEALKDCLEAAGSQLAPPAAHSSSFDADALKLLLGEGFERALVDKVVDAMVRNVDSATRARVLATLTDYIDDAPAHRLLDLAQHGVFDRAGYQLASVSFTDSGRADIDADGALEPHTTLIVQVSKPLAYARAPAEEVDVLLRQPDGALPQEPYVVQLQAHIHLGELARLRQDEGAVPSGDESVTEAQEAAREQARWINLAMDANVLRRLVQSEQPIPWASSEYVVSFQVAPQAITGQLGDALAGAVESGDADAAQALELHLDAASAILTSADVPGALGVPQAGAQRVDVFYQAVQPRLAAVRWSGANLEYGMFDAAGNRVALSDPVSGATILAGEPRAASAAPGGLLKLTKAGSCEKKSSGWSYYPAKVQTGRFGRGINWILPEVLVHSQVGDYKNIHWYQSAWKASAQVAIKSGMWIVKQYLQVQFANAKVPPKDDRKYSYALFYVLEVVMPYMTNFVSDGHGGGKTFRIAGWSHRVDARVIRMMVGGASYKADPTFAQKVRYAAMGFLIDRVSDGVGQSLDVTVTGWQDYSDASHYGCFEFSY